jgi:hypothetical protein
VLGSAKQAEDEETEVRSRDRQALILEIVEVFHAYDARGKLRMGELRNLLTIFLEAEGIQARCKEAGLSLEDMKDAIIDAADGSGEIEYEEFLIAVTKFDNDTIRFDTLELQSRIRGLIHACVAHHKEQTERIESFPKTYHWALKGMADRMERKTDVFRDRVAAAMVGAGLATKIQTPRRLPELTTNL